MYIWFYDTSQLINVITTVTQLFTTQIINRKRNQVINNVQRSSGLQMQCNNDIYDDID